MTETITYTGLGIALVSLTFWLVRSLIRRAVKRSESEGSVDDRVVRLSSVQDGIIEDLRGELAKKQDEVNASTARYVALVDSIQNRIEAAVERLAAEHRESMQRMHVRIDGCEERHQKCEAEQRADREACDARYDDAMAKLGALEKAVKAKRRA